MKLNLLPTHVSKQGQAKTALIFSIVMVLASIVAAVLMNITSSKDLADAKKMAEDLKPQAQAAVDTAKLADAMLAGTAPFTVPAPTLQRNIQLAQAMQAHSPKYPELYGVVMDHIPSFFRLTSLQAQPAGDTAALVTMTGVIDTFQEYADLMLALLRIPGATGVTRTGFNVTDMFVPELITEDQVGTPIRPGQARVPSTPIDRLNAVIANAEAGTTGFSGVGNFGIDDPFLTKGAMPNSSEITVSVLIDGQPIKTPDPRASLRPVAGGGGGGGGMPAPGNTAPTPGRTPGTGSQEDE
ncbi:MAG TPA: hypothetical protein PLH94_15085 [Fimbriimonadaceae bacterium]|nr:hypothetical protein [Fimbriimonadaceae bacterium]